MNRALRIHGRLALLSVATILFVPAFASAFTRGDPIPGLDVKLGKNPGGIIATGKTGADGKFVFDNLAPGKYVVSFAQPQTRAMVSTTRSNIKHQSLMLTGVQVLDLAVAIGQDVLAPYAIEITSAHGRITGTVTRATASADTPAAGATAVKKPRL